MSTGHVVGWLQMIRGEFEEASDLCLTAQQARELWDLEPGVLQGLLDALVDVGFLSRSAGQVYSRRLGQALAGHGLVKSRVMS